MLQNYNFFGVEGKLSEKLRLQNKGNFLNADSLDVNEVG